MYWCLYTDSDLPKKSTNREHIIPLSLGGANNFCIRVDANFNSEVGSRIDGVIAKDLLVLLRRRYFCARGHSKKSPQVILKKSTIGKDKRPVQIALHGGGVPDVFDVKEKRLLNLEEFKNQQAQSSFTIGKFDRLRFMAKVSLAAGYFVYGEFFRRYANHSELRALMNFDLKTSKLEDFIGNNLIVHDGLMPPLTENSSHQERLLRFLCDAISGSCILILPGHKNIGFIIGVLGAYMGKIDVPIIADHLPIDNEYDLGHVIELCDRKMRRRSFRALLQETAQVLSTKVV